MRRTGLATGKVPLAPEQGYLDQARIEENNYRYDKAIEYASQALQNEQTCMQGFLIRSRCHAALAHFAEALQDAETLIKLEEQAKANGVDGYFARANAEFLSGRFEDALVDYHRCKRLKQDKRHQAGIDNTYENIRRAFDFTRAEVQRAVQLIDAGKIVEDYAVDAQGLLTCAVKQEADESAPRYASPTDTAEGAGSATRALRSGSLPFSTAHKTLMEIETAARNAPGSQKLGQLAIDREFMRFISDVPRLRPICERAEKYIAERERFWNAQSEEVQSEVMEVRPKTGRKLPPSIQTFQLKDTRRSQSGRCYTQSRRETVTQNLRKAVNERRFEHLQRESYAQKLKTVDQAKADAKARADASAVIRMNVQMAIEAKNFELALEFANELEARLGGQADELVGGCRFIKAQILLQLGRADECLAYCDGKSPECQRLRAHALLRSEKDQEARAVFESMAECAVKEVQLDAKLNLALILFAQRCFQEALDFAQQTVTLLKRSYDTRRGDAPIAIQGDLVYRVLVRDMLVQALQLKDQCLERLGMADEAAETRFEINTTLAPIRKQLSLKIDSAPPASFPGYGSLETARAVGPDPEK